MIENYCVTVYCYKESVMEPGEYIHAIDYHFAGKEDAQIFYDAVVADFGTKHVNLYVDSKSWSPVEAYDNLKTRLSGGEFRMETSQQD